MSNSFEKSVKGGTKVKLAPPKTKYVEHILLATQSGEAGVAEVFRTLQNRLRDSTWTVAFKALIIVHLMIKEGQQEVTLRYLSVSPRNRLAINTFTDVQTQGQNIRVYSEYLLARALAYERTRCDYVRAGEGRMKRLTVDKGLLREAEVVQSQIAALVRCDFLTNDVENEISLTAFRLLTRDLLDLYNVENEAVMNVLSHYFEMSRPDAERAIIIYKKFCKQTEQVVEYLSVARHYEHATRLAIPKLKHAPTSLAASLQEYLDDKDFEINRRQYLAEQESKKPFGKTSAKTATAAKTTTQPAAPMPTPFDDMKSGATAAPASQSAKGPAPNLIDFFESIESNQHTMQTNPFLQQPQQQQQQPPQQMQMQVTGYQQQPPTLNYSQDPQAQFNGYTGTAVPQNPYDQQLASQAQSQPQPIQAQYTGAGFGGYSPQPPQQQALSTGQTTNPFRLSMMQTGANATGSTFGQQALNRQSTNPFAKNSFAAIPENGPTPPLPQQSSMNGSQSPFQPQPLQAQTTGTNPFARSTPSLQQSSTPNALQVQPTGSTNPFRQSQFVNQQTGSGWQHGPQHTMGGMENLETVPVFPRPGAQPTQQQQPWV
ncbi:hypothetical protein CERZMDRAFT_43190 [Cercospora zeae-maydis SCOH1-5]|uniref:ENTH domain-containing protein n=1 Tax=Cercospora zeae-maydis SCOH1-5 TaxID=717836 RepID=A0A6A6FE12_9PEZI|nr:hypothetical protein CERZMDRAFT_43190 [Cercospora zeae-maydis SCOH1-5]